MMRSARKFLIVATSIVGVFITPAVSSTANVLQKVEKSATRERNRSAVRTTQDVNKHKCKLLVRVESPTSSSTGIPPLTLTLRNEGRSAIYIVERAPSKDFKFEIKDDAGKIVLPKQGLVVEEGKQAIVPVNAGQEVSYTIGLDDRYSLVSGIYTLTVTKPFFLSDRQSIMEVKSAPVKLVLKLPK